MKVWTRNGILILILLAWNDFRCLWRSEIKSHSNSGSKTAYLKTVRSKNNSKKKQMTMRKHAFYGILALVSLLGLGITQSARANFIATIHQVGTDVRVTGSGTIDTTFLSLFLSGAGNTASIRPNSGNLLFASGLADWYTGFSGPTSFGSGGITFASSNSGNPVGIDGGGGNLFVPQGYVSGTFLSDTSTYNNATFASLGITPGTYTWTWGTGVHADSFTLQIGPAGVPDAGSTLPLLGFASLGLVALRRKLGC